MHFLCSYVCACGCVLYTQPRTLERVVLLVSQRRYACRCLRLLKSVSLCIIYWLFVILPSSTRLCPRPLSSRGGVMYICYNMHPLVLITRGSVLHLQAIPDAPPPPHTHLPTPPSRALWWSRGVAPTSPLSGRITVTGRNWGWHFSDWVAPSLNLLRGTLTRWRPVTCVWGDVIVVAPTVAGNVWYFAWPATVTLCFF